MTSIRPSVIFTPSFRPDPKPEPKEKKPPVPLKRTPISKKRTPTGEAELFMRIWTNRPHRSFIDGYPLGDDPCAYMFAHVLPKAENKYPKMKLYEKNIVLLTYEQHDVWDKGRHKIPAGDPNWKRLFDLEAELKEEYKQLK